jgi:hypothetical protein
MRFFGEAEDEKERGERENMLMDKRGEGDEED